MALMCPQCGRKIKTSPFLIQNTVFRCQQCGTRVTVAPGFFKSQIVDWETPEERGNRTLGRN